MADLATAYVKIVPSLKGAQSTIKKELDGVDSKSSGRKIGEGIKTGIGSIAIGNFLANILTSAAEKAVAAMRDIIVGAFNNYADYEQLVGGVEKLYGESSQRLLQYADQAYLTMGKSKNEDRRQVTSFSAALISDLGGDTAAAADQANKAMSIIADNVSIFGSNVEDVENAFQGFAKQNYTMLDNLKLGYGGTKSEMERLIADANEYAESMGLASNLTIDSFSDVVTAIDLIQQKQGIAGNAMVESQHTIQGAMASTKAAYDNLLTVLGDPNGDISAAVTALVDQVANAAELIIPKITDIMIALSEAIPELVDKMLPVISEHAGELIESLAKVISALAPVMLEAAGILFLALIDALVEVGKNLVTNLGNLILELVQKILDGVGPAMEAAGEFMQGILDAIVGFFGNIYNAGAELVNQFISGIAAWGQGVVDFFANIIDAAVQTISNFWQHLYNAGVNLINGLVQGIADSFWAVVDTIVGGLQSAYQGALEFLGIASPSKLFAAVGENTMLGFAKGIDSASSEAEKSMQSAMDGVYGAADGVASVSMAAEAEGAGSMAAEVASLRDELRQMRLVLNIDGRAFAEATVGEMDRAMGTMSRRAYAR